MPMPPSRLPKPSRTPRIFPRSQLFSLQDAETPTLALTWTLYALARAPTAQTRLHAALRACDTSDFHAVLYLLLLEHTVREALRVHAPVSGTCCTLRVYAGAAPECFVP